MRRVCFFAALVAAVPLCGWPQAAPAPQQPAPAQQPVATPSAAPAQEPSPPAPTPSATAGGTIAGVIKSGQTPLPGVTVTAKNTLTGKQYVTATDSHGAFALHIDADGRYVVRADFAAFAGVTKEVRAARRYASSGDRFLSLAGVASGAAGAGGGAPCCGQGGAQGQGERGTDGAGRAARGSTRAVRARRTWG